MRFLFCWEKSFCWTQYYVEPNAAFHFFGNFCCLTYMFAGKYGFYLSAWVKLIQLQWRVQVESTSCRNWQKVALMAVPDTNVWLELKARLFGLEADFIPKTSFFIHKSLFQNHIKVFQKHLTKLQPNKWKYKCLDCSRNQRWFFKSSTRQDDLYFQCICTHRVYWARSPDENKFWLKIYDHLSKKIDDHLSKHLRGICVEGF